MSSPLGRGMGVVWRGLRSPGRALALWWSLAARAPHLLAPFRFPGEAERLLDPFRDEGARPSARAYEGLLRYVAEGWRLYRLDEGHGADYPGLPSWSGREADRLEGFARLMPLFGAWCASGRPDGIRLVDGSTLDLPGEFARGLAAGTDPDAPTFWGDMPGRSNQRIVEAADVALALWLFRDSVWRELGDERRRRVVEWLGQVRGREGLDSNWHLFFVVVDRVLEALGHPGRVPSARLRWERVKEFDLGDGWFSDGPEGRVDYYNAWGFHYPMAMIARIDPAWDPGFIEDRRRRFLSTYRYFIGPRGVPIMGRSVCYRMALPVPQVLGHASAPDVVSTGEARRALDAVWSYFVGAGAVTQGRITQGYFGSDPRILDPYSGPASPLWSLRSLVAAFLHPPDDPFWTGAPEPLPVERGDYEVPVDGPGWVVRGRQDTGAITLDVLTNPPGAAPPLQDVRPIQTLRSLAFGEALRPKNWEAAYGRRTYRSDRPFFQENEA